MLVLRRAGGGIRTLAAAARATVAEEGANCRALSTSRGLPGWFFSEDAAKKSGHSSLLSDANTVYEVISETVTPKDWELYIQHKAATVEMNKNRRDFAAVHLASWRFIYGDEVYKAMHLYKYPNGWADLDKTRLAEKADEEFHREIRSGQKLITQQSTEFLKSFSFWPVPDARTGGNIYDVRSYELKPGSMYDWGNYWAKGINYRKQVRPDLPYAGFFSQIGKLQVVYHIWVYADLEDRNSCRKRSWNQENWGDVVTNTVPLVRSMATRILEPLPFSPTQ